MQKTQQTKHDFILEVLQKARPMLRSIAWDCAKDYEDYEDLYDELYQVAAVTVLEAYNRAQAASNPYGYLLRAIRYEVFQYTGIAKPINRRQTLADHYQIQSFDAPLNADSDLSLYDLVGEAAPVKSDDRDSSHLSTIINALPEIDRTAFCMRFGLCGHGMHRLCEMARALGISQSAANQRVRRAQAMLREYTELRDLVERHL